MDEMKKPIMLFFVIFFLLIWGIRNYLGDHPNDPIYRIYQQEINMYSFDLKLKLIEYLRFVPSIYRNNIDKFLLSEEKNEYYKPLYLISRPFKPYLTYEDITYYFIVFGNLSNPEEFKFLRSEYPILLGRSTNEAVNLTDFISTGVFNDYIVERGISHPDTIIAKYFYFISVEPNESKFNHKLLYSIKDVKSILELKPSYDDSLNSTSSKYLKYEQLDFTNKKLIYCWFASYGVHSFEFLFEDNKLSLVLASR